MMYLLGSVVCAQGAILTDGGFESPALANNTFQYAFPGSSWTFSPSAGVARGMFSPWAPGTGMTIAEGQQFAFVQGNGASITQSLNFSSAGTYELSFLKSGRTYYSSFDGDTTFDVLLGGNLLGHFGTTSDENWSPLARSTVSFSVAAGSSVLQFINTTTTTSPHADHSFFIDDVRVTQTSASVNEDGTILWIPIGIGMLVLVRRRINQCRSTA
jgi:hypothetical protein